MNLTARILALLTERGWSKYQLAKEAHLSQSTVSSLIIRGSVPTISTIESCCNAFGITMAEFFNSDLQGEKFTPEEEHLVYKWRNVPASIQGVVTHLLDAAQLPPEDSDPDKAPGNE
jgi:transcriptional regulator with XRE-family HTH domain